MYYNQNIGTHAHKMLTQQIIVKSSAHLTSQSHWALASYCSEVVTARWTISRKFEYECIAPDVKFLNDRHLVATSWSKSFYSLRGENLIRHWQTVGMADQEVDENISQSCHKISPLHRLILKLKEIRHIL